MFLGENSSRLRGGWPNAGRSFAAAQWRRLGLGCIVGSLVGIGVHLLTRDSGFASLLQQKSANLAITKSFDGFRAYRPEVVALCIGIAVVAVVPTLLWLWR